MHSIKPGVNLAGIAPEMAIANSIVFGCFQEHGTYTVITSALDGKHSRTSLHYVGFALDYRTRHITAVESELIAGRIRECLGEQFDVIRESTHIHVEFQPKR